MLQFYIIALLAFLAAVSPGPDFVVVARQAITQNRTNAVMASLGIGVGMLIHSIYCVLGLAIVISQSLLIFSIVKYLGAAYLIYLGIKSLLSKANHLEIKPKNKVSLSKWSAFRNGLLTNLLNPKCTLFMLSIFTMAVDPDTSTFTQAFYGIEIAFVDVVWFSLLSYLLTIAILKSKIEKIQNVITKVMGGILIALGVVIAFE